MYKHLFVANVLRVLGEQRMTKRDLAKASGVSVSFLSDVTTGKGNPSLRIMEAVANALDVSLPSLLEAMDLDEEAPGQRAARRRTRSSLPPGYARVTAILPSHRAVIVRKWSEETRKRRGKSLLPAAPCSVPAIAESSRPCNAGSV